MVGLFVALSIVIPTFRAGDLVQLLGISGVAIGFAFRDILQNFLAGILILLTEPFQIDDQIVFKNFEGTVENIETRATTIRTYDGRQIVIPNSELFTNSVTVNTAFENSRLEYDVGIGYGDDIDQAKQLMLEAMHSVPEDLDKAIELLFPEKIGHSEPEQERRVTEIPISFEEEAYPIRANATGYLMRSHQISAG